MCLPEFRFGTNISRTFFAGHVVNSVHHSRPTWTRSRTHDSLTQLQNSRPRFRSRWFGSHWRLRIIFQSPAIPPLNLLFFLSWFGDQYFLLLRLSTVVLEDTERAELCPCIRSTLSYE